MSKKNTIFATVLLMEPMPKENGIKHNNLNFNVLPTPIEEGEDLHAEVLELSGPPSQPEDNPSFYASRLIRRLIAVADKDCSHISFQDREWLEDVLRGMTPEKISHYSKVPASRIYNHVKRALDFLCHKIDKLEHTQNILAVTNDRVQLMKSQAREREAQIMEMSQYIEKLERENSFLQSRLDEYKSLEERKRQFIPIDEKTQASLHRKLKDIGIPPVLSMKLNDQKIQTVLELVRHTEQEILQIQGISEYYMDIIKRCLRHYGFSLGSNIRWVPTVNKYYIYPNEN